MGRILTPYTVSLPRVLQTSYKSNPVFWMLIVAAFAAITGSYAPSVSWGLMGAIAGLSLSGSV